MRYPILASIAALAVLAGCSTKPNATQIATQPGADAPAAGSTPATAATPVPAAATPAPAAVRQPPPPLVIPEGAEIRVRTTTAISTKTHQTGQRFEASLMEPIVVGTTVIAPKGARVEGVVSDADAGGRVHGRAHISIRLASVAAAGDKSLEVNTTSFTRIAPGTKKKDAMKIGIGSGVGAAIGAIAGGGAGAAIGAGAGAGAGTGVVLATRGDPAVIASETPVTFKLKNAVTVKN